MISDLHVSVRMSFHMMHLKDVFRTSVLLLELQCCVKVYSKPTNCKVCISICMSHSLASECQISSNFFASLSEQDLLGAVLI